MVGEGLVRGKVEGGVECQDKGQAFHLSYCISYYYQNV